MPPNPGPNPTLLAFLSRHHSEGRPTVMRFGRAPLERGDRRTKGNKHVLFYCRRTRQAARPEAVQRMPTASNLRPRQGGADTLERFLGNDDRAQLLERSGPLNVAREHSKSATTNAPAGDSSTFGTLLSLTCPDRRAVRHTGWPVNPARYSSMPQQTLGSRRFLAGRVDAWSCANDCVPPRPLPKVERLMMEMGSR